MAANVADELRSDENPSPLCRDALKKKRLAQSVVGLKCETQNNCCY